MFHDINGNIELNQNKPCCDKHVLGSLTYNKVSLNWLHIRSLIYSIMSNLKSAAKLGYFYFVSDGVRLRATRGGSADPRTFSSRRSSTDSSEDGFNINVRDLKVIYALSCTSLVNFRAVIIIVIIFTRR